MPTTKPIPKDCVVPNVMQCSLCQGTVYRFGFGFQCRDCTAFGDFNTGIMVRLDREYYEQEFGADTPTIVTRGS